MSSVPISVTEISIQPGRDYVSRIRRIVECVADSLGMGIEQADDAKAAVSEACANALEHGILVGPLEGLKVRFCTHDNSLVAEVSGNGEHKDLRFLAPEEEPHAGIGISLMRSLADRVEFLKNGSGMTVRLTKVVDRHTEA